MSWPDPVRKAVGIVAASLVTISLGVAVGVFVAGPAAASSPTTTTTTPTLSSGSDPNSPAARYLVINGTVDAASDHEIVGSSAFPNYATGAVDNYYSKAHTHVDNSPFAQGTASPADTGPIGQTAAAGNFQQPQYADARWPGGPDKATYGSQGGPYAVAEADEYKATAESSAASIGLSGPSAIAVPKGLDGRLQRALAAWKAKWQGRLEPKRPPATVKTPTATIPTPAATLTTPTATVTTPSAVGSLTTPPSVPVPSPSVPSATAPGATTPARSLSSVPGDGASLLESSTRTILDPKTGALVTSGESRLGRVSLGGGQIVLEGIHVSATITNDGTPSEKVAVSVGSASIGGVPVTIDQDGVHVAGQSQGLPYQQASDALNSALKQAGIQLFIVAPEIKTNSCDQTGTTSSGTTTTTTTTTTTPSGPTGTTPTTTSCDQTGMTPMSTSCGQTDATPTTTTTSSYPIGTTPTTTSSRQTSTTTTTTSSGQTGTAPTSSSCDQSGTTPTSTSCGQTGTTTKASSSQETGTTTTTTSSDQTGTGTGTTNSGEETVTATGLHVVFTQPVAQSGVPAQYAEHILGEVFLDSLAVPAGPVPNLDLNLNLNSSSCGPGSHSFGKKTAGGTSAGGSGSSAAGPASSSSISSTSSSPSSSSQPTASWTGSGSQPTSSSPGNAVQASSAGLVSALRKKPLWLLVTYLLWQALVIGTGASLWKWRRGGAS